MRFSKSAAGIVAALVLGSLAFQGYRAYTLIEPRKTVQTYFGGIVAGDSGKVEAVLTGSALTSYRRAVAGKAQAKAEITDTNTRWLVTAGMIAVADVTVQIRQNQTVDVQTARLSMSKVDGGWRIFQVETAPLTYGGGLTAQKTEAVQLVKDYLAKSLAGDYDSALRLLAGQARSEAEATLAVVKQAKLTVQAKGLDVTVTDTQGSTIWVTATYKATVGENDSRPVTLLLEVRPIGGKLAIVKSSTL